MKDNFSVDASKYALFRPDYPDTLIDFILKETPGRDTVWDSGTGNGQLAKKLAPHFQTVIATDISDDQLLNAEKADNIIYRKLPAEQTDFTSKQFDLITVAQAVHWFHFDAFYTEVNRTLKDDGLFVITGYSLLKINPVIDALILHFHNEVVGAYWDAERHYVTEHYQTIPFPFQEIAAPQLEQVYQWHFDQLTGYLNTWSAVKHFLRQEHKDPVALIIDDLKTLWGADQTKTVHFPTLIRAGRTL